MADETVATPETAEVEETTEESTPEQTEETAPEVEPQKQTVPYERFKEVNDELREIKSAVKNLEARREEKPLSPEEQQTLEAKKYLRGVLEEVLTEKETQKAQEEAKRLEEYKADVSRLSETFKDFDGDTVTKFANKHEIDDLERAYWRMKAEGKITVETPKPKLPKATATADTIQRDKVDTSGLDLYQAVAKAKTQHGL